MAPAFSSTKQAAGFALLLVLLFLSPMLVGKRFLPPRKEVYASMTWKMCSTDFLYRQIFEETNDIDIAFIGSSRMRTGIDTPYVQQELTQKLGRKAVVLTLAWSWLGFDADYFITQDLLQNRKVHMIVFDDEYRADDVPHVAATHWFRFGDNWESVKGVPWHIQLAYYFSSVLGMPRNFLSLIRSNIPDDLITPEVDYWRKTNHAENPDRNFGALILARMPFPNTPFIPFIPSGNAQSSDVCVYSQDDKNKFRFSGSPDSQWQLQFAKLFADEAQSHDTKLVFLHLCPGFSSNETNSPVIEERRCWPEVLGTNVALIGIPPAKLYSGIKSDDILKLFYTADRWHYNKNGGEFFTRLITPTLIHIYETQAVH